MAGTLAGNSGEVPRIMQRAVSFCYAKQPMESYGLILLAGLAAGFVNAIAGGGTLLSFPALIFAGLPAITANATNTLALWLGSATSAHAYRRQLAGHRPTVVRLAVPSLAGGLIGAVLLLSTPEKLFRGLVPYLILLACGLLLLQPRIARLVSQRLGAPLHAHARPLWFIQLAIGIYGGYFGAGIGILMLAALAICLPEDLQAANGLKNLFATLINGAAVVYFMVTGAANLPVAATMAVAAIAGGFLGAHTAQRLSPALLRWLVVGYGLVVAGYFWLR